MAPRNDDANTSFKKDDDNDIEVEHIVPCLLHKKHKVVKLIRNHLENINQEGLFTNIPGCESEVLQVETFSPRLGALRSPGEEEDMNSTSQRNSTKFQTFLSILLILLLLLILITLMVWISAGPLSNSMPHTPIMYGSFVRTDYICSLEKKYLLRWSKPEYFE